MLPQNKMASKTEKQEREKEIKEETRNMKEQNM